MQEVFLDRPGNLPHQQKQQQHRGLVPGFPNPLPLSEEERERGAPSKAEPRFRRFHFSYLCFFFLPFFLLSVAQYLNDDEVYVTTERQRGREGEEK